MPCARSSLGTVHHDSGRKVLPWGAGSAADQFRVHTQSAEFLGDDLGWEPDVQVLVHEEPDFIG
jgi:hypothetical protein